MNWIIGVIIACEIGFWVFVMLGLFSRYILRKKTLGLFFLAMTPAVDLVLLIVSGIDLYHGAHATFAHALAAVYIGVSVAFGKQMIRWADEKFQTHVLKQQVQRKKLYGLEYAKIEFKGWSRHLLAYLIGAGLIGLTVVFIHDLERTAAMLRVLATWTAVLIIDLIISVSYFIFPKTEK
ncbi:hypothetical protein GCM10010978_30020 [Compostibacillus humi]|uniref:Integral inner membrane protein n=1 Tax=Compostibacillus humi TaxID=1245525 RepID=A0A8J2TTJ5_9BACI|nr:hypothetical protein [Compostibacillus humi]GFZ88413.1 hypothetical protein GCM10010978_30020 [Compostibacillus humi]